MLAMNPPIGRRSTLKILQSVDGGKNYSLIWTGHITIGEWSNWQVKVSLESVASDLNHMGLRENFVRECRFCVYDRKCAVSREQNTITVTVGTTTGTVITITEPLTDIYQFGLLEFDLLDYQINIQSKQTLTLARAAPIVPGDKIKLSAGCDWDISTCHKRFKNAINFGGNPNMPKKNPFEGDPINR